VPLELPPLSLYVHLPWCVRKCPYCDFNSYEARGDVPDRDYVDALLRDLDAEAPFAYGRSLGSIFIGGGTPSLFSGAAIERLVEGVRARIAVAPQAELTLEANPGSVEAKRFAEFREAGINRLSIGVQSFRNPQLALLGRVHDSTDAMQAFATARDAGFDNVNLDLMYALPGDDIDGALADLATAADLGPAHLSWYQLTLEPNTAFYRRPPALPAEEIVIEIEARGRRLLAARGYSRYEVSAYATPGRTCAHNLNYWRFGDYLGIGAGAHGKVTLPEQHAIVRRAKQRNPRTYLEQAGSPAAVTLEHIDAEREITVEFMMNALRLADGVAAACYVERTGRPFDTITRPVDEAVRRGWMCAEPGVLRATPAGLQVLNSLLALFVA
jgi:putative oxygen-independent coproporphyrinogen III oxidase